MAIKPETKKEIAIIIGLLFFIVIGWYFIFSYLETVKKTECADRYDREDNFGFYRSLCDK